MVATKRGIVQIVLPRKNRQGVEREIGGAKRGTRGVEKMHAADSKLLTHVVKLLKRYCSGRSVSFDLPLDLRYYTAFQQAVWRATAAIPFGETRSYAWIATRIKRPKAVRAVGQALGANPVPILIP
jgi:O6-methylguanine-DNA--protein-cysteine methyltransferase